MIVVDASVMLDLLLSKPKASMIRRRLLQHGETISAPHVLDLEVAQVLRRYAAARELDPQRGRQAMQHLADFPVTRHSHIPLLQRIWDLRHNLTAYDAAYIALAEVLDATLVTVDAKLGQFAGHSATIEMI